MASSPLPRHRSLSRAMKLSSAGIIHRTYLIDEIRNTLFHAVYSPETQFNISSRYVQWRDLIGNNQLSNHGGNQQTFKSVVWVPFLGVVEGLVIGCRRCSIQTRDYMESKPARDDWGLLRTPYVWVRKRWVISINFLVSTKRMFVLQFPWFNLSCVMEHDKFFQLSSVISLVSGVSRNALADRCSLTCIFRIVTMTIDEYVSCSCKRVHRRISVRTWFSLSNRQHRWEVVRRLHKNDSERMNEREMTWEDMLLR